jgi:hypothetical protein
MQQRPLIYLGGLTSIRPLQLAKFSCISKIKVYDNYLDSKTFDEFKHYISDRSFLKNKGKISVVNSRDSYKKLLKQYKTSPVFLDLTYFRSAIQPDPGNFRHHLKQDLKNLIYKKASHSTIYGNMANHPYVKYVLEQLANENNLKINKRGSIWFFNVL